MNSIGEVLHVLRISSGRTQAEVAEHLGITQAAFSRYENDLREPDPDALVRIADAFGVTPEFLTHNFRAVGAVAAHAHMRRQRTARPGDWRRVEARLNILRMHAAYIASRIPLDAENHVPSISSESTTPVRAAQEVRSTWRLPIGPVRSLVRWLESAGVLIFEEELHSPRIDGMSQWAGEAAVIIINSSLPTDRKRMTLAHELGHLVLHNQADSDTDVEREANEFAAEFLMPEAVIASQLTRLTLGRLSDLKAEWGVSMQALFERAHGLRKATKDDRARFYRQLNSKGWKVHEPGSDTLPPETPVLAASIGRQLADAGLTRHEIHLLIGAADDADTPFEPTRLRLIS